MGRESFLLRGQVFETESASHVGADGVPDRVTIRGFTPNGDAAESFAIAEGRATWKSPVDGGSTAYTAPAEYAAFGGPIDLTADLAERLIASRDRSLALLPAGRARAEPLGKGVVGDGDGGAGLTVTFTSCPSTVRNSISRPTDTDTGLQRISADTCACVVPSSFAASCCVTPHALRSL